MVEPDSNESPCAACAGLGVVVVDSYANGRERHDEVPCDECSPGDELHEAMREAAYEERDERPALVTSYDERPFDGDRDFAHLDNFDFGGEV